MENLSTVNSIENENKEKEAGNAPFSSEKIFVLDRGQDVSLCVWKEQK